MDFVLVELWSRAAFGTGGGTTTVVVTETFAGAVWPAAVRLTVVVLEELVGAVLMEVTTRKAVLDAPGARERVEGLMVEGVVKLVELESLTTLRAKFVIVHPPVSLFVTDMV